MSGIAGIVCFDAAPIARGLIDNMTTAMAHRGPDGIHHWSSDSIVLGHCALKTTPESLEESQPHLSEDASLVLVMDGRVDNWEELRRLLLAGNAVLRNRSDAELLLRSYQRWGPDCLHHIDGDFALAIWDARRREIFCARDRMGWKPFLYYWDGVRFAFASEPAALLTLPWVRRNLNEGMVSEFLANDWCTLEETFWQGVLRIVAAHRLVVSSAGPRIERYWAPDTQKVLRYQRQEEYVEHYRELLFDVVRRLSRSHKPLACEVSGGLDSSALFSVGEELRRNGRLPAPGIDGYTLLFDDGSAADEVDYARAVGRHLAREIREIPPTWKPLSWHGEVARRHAVFPPYPNGSFALGIREAARKEGSAVLLTGNGGDQFLCGTRTYYAEALTRGDWKTFVECLVADVRACGWQNGVSWILRHGVFPLLPERLQTHIKTLLRRGPASHAEQRHRLTSKLLAALQTQRKKRSGVPPGRMDQREQLASLFNAYSKYTLEAQEWIAASAGIELRAPFYCKPMVEFALSTEARKRLRGATDRIIHREAMVGLLPETVRNRSSKADYTIAFEWYLAELNEHLLGKDPAALQGWVGHEALKGLFEQSGNPAFGAWPHWTLWSIFGCAALADGDKLKGIGCVSAPREVD